MDRFISAEVAVVIDAATRLPKSFEWNGRVYAVNEILAVWPDYGFSAGAPKKKSWRLRRHRNCYRVVTADGEVFELYNDRGTGQTENKWILSLQVS